MIAFIAVLVAILVVGVLVKLAAWLIDRGDPFPRQSAAPEGSDGLGERPPEIAHEPPRRSIHELPPLGDTVWHQLPIRGDAQEREGGCAPADSRPAARADMTGFLSPRSPMEDPGSLARGGPGQASPAAPPPPLADYTGAAPGTAAAAGISPPAPPPLPDPAYAAANPTAYPLTWLESDTFVSGLTAIKDGA